MKRQEGTKNGAVEDSLGHYAIGLMSGTSLDGADAAVISSDGQGCVEAIAFETRPFERGLRDRLRLCLGGKASPAEIAEAERDLTLFHVPLVEDLLANCGLERRDIAVIGFHGQTLLHAPEQGRTWQIGDGRLLADSLGIDVVNDFRSADVAAGGQGAPFAPLYHAARAADLAKPLAILNIGGVANVTWLGEAPDEIMAFDTGPGNALLDDWMWRHGAGASDEDGRCAARGQEDDAGLTLLFAHPYFRQPPPKSLDRDAFDTSPLASLTLNDGAATLTAFTVEAVAAALQWLPAPPLRWLVSGGGRRNPTILSHLRERLNCPVEPVEAVGWNGDAIEAEAFAYLALRSLAKLPLSLPSTTGVAQPLSGGQRHLAVAQ